MSLDRKKLKKVVAGFSEEEKEAFFDELSGSVSRAVDDDILATLMSLSARVEDLEKGSHKKSEGEPPDIDPDKKKKGFFESIDDFLKKED